MNYVVPNSRKILCQHRNGDDFTTNPTTDFVDYFQGNAFETLRVDTEFIVYTISKATDDVKFKAQSWFGTGVQMVHPTNNWNTVEGFVVGNQIRVEANGNSANETVLNIIDNVMIISDTSFFSTLGVTDGELRSDYVIKVTSAPTALEFKFGILPNSVTANSYNSLLDGQEQVYRINTSTASPTYTDLDYISSESSDLGGVAYTYGGASGTGNYVFTFTVRHTVRIPHFVDSWLANILDDLPPTPFMGTNSYRYVSKLRFCNSISNPNDRKEFTDDFLLGSVGHLDQNFNGLPPVYELVSCTFDVGGVAVTVPRVHETTTVTAQIQRTDGNFAAGVKAYLYHSLATNADDYSLNLDSFDTNFVFDQLAVNDGDIAASSTIIKDLVVSVNGVDASLLDITFDLVYTSAQQLRISNGQNILIGIGVEDGTILIAEESDRTIVKLTDTAVAKSLERQLLTAWDLDINAFGSVGISQEISTWVNRAYEMNFTFDLQKDADSSYAKINGLRYMMVGFNTTTEDYFKLDEFEFPLGAIPFVTVDGTDYQVKNLDTTRFLSFPSDAAIREVQLNIPAPAGSSYEATQTVTGKLGFVIPWREWIENTAVPMSFYDAALVDEFFNRNERTSNYSGVDGYDIYIFLVANLSYQENVGGKLTEIATFDQVLHSNACTIYDFEEDGLGTGWATDSITVYDPSGDATDDIFKTGLNTIEVIASNPGIGGLSPQSIAAEIIVEEENGSGRHWRLDSVLDFTELDNPLQPLSGESGVKITIDGVGNTITLECDLDGSNPTIDLTKTYNIYYHIKVKT